IAPRNSTTVLVQTDSTRLGAVKTPGGTDSLYMRHAADVCSLTGSAVAVVQGVPIDAIVRYDIPRGSFRDFAIRQTKKDVRGFEISPVVCDDLLCLLSRSVASLL